MKFTLCEDELYEMLTDDPYSHLKFSTGNVWNKTVDEVTNDKSKNKFVENYKERQDRLIRHWLWGTVLLILSMKEAERSKDCRAQQWLQYLKQIIKEVQCSTHSRDEEIASE